MHTDDTAYAFFFWKVLYIARCKKKKKSRVNHSSHLIYR